MQVKKGFKRECKQAYQRKISSFGNPTASGKFQVQDEPWESPTDSETLVPARKMTRTYHI
jgi:hypothetical protein